MNRTADWSWKLKYNGMLSFYLLWFARGLGIDWVGFVVAFRVYGMDVLASFTFWPSVRLGFHIGDADVAKV